MPGYAMKVNKLSSDKGRRQYSERLGPVLVYAFLMFAAGAAYASNGSSIGTAMRRMDVSDFLRGADRSVKKTEGALNGESNFVETGNAPNGKSKPLSLLQQMAPTIFPMEPGDYTTIRFPATVEHVVIDVGARESDYLNTLEQEPDPSVALIMVDPLPESALPLVSRAAAYNLKGLQTGQYPNPDYGDHVFFIRGAMGEHEATTNFQVAPMPACGSILKTTDENKFACWGTTNQLPVQIFTLESLMSLIPNNSTAIKSIHLKTDCEGADHFALKGAGEALGRFTTVVIECSPPHGSPGDFVGLRREGMCNNDEVIQWMCEDNRPFCTHRVVPQGGLSNIFFSNQQMKITPDQIPAYLTKPWIEFRALYQELRDKVSAS